MVESQRDLLVKAIQELRQKSTACRPNGTNWDATTDINKTLQDLGVHADASDIVRESFMEELAAPGASRKIVNPAEIQDDQSRFQSKDAMGNKLPSLNFSPADIPSMSVLNTQSQSEFDFAETTTDLNLMFNTNGQFDKAASFDTGIGFGDGSSFDETMLMQNWPPSTPPNLNFQIPSDLEYLNMETDLSRQLQQNSKQR